MDLPTLRLLFAGGVLAVGVLAVLLALGLQWLGEWVRSRRERVLVEPLAGTTDRERDRASEKALRSGHARWRTLLGRHCQRLRLPTPAVLVRLVTPLAANRLAADAHSAGLAAGRRAGRDATSRCAARPAPSRR
jgi:hypothetical protein